MTAPVTSPQRPPPAPKAIPKPCKGDGDCDSTQLCVQSACVDAASAGAACAGLQVRFGFDEAILHGEARDVLVRAARCIQAQPGSAIRIEGHADERGTAEYNIALGDRRAWAVRKYLHNLGVEQARLATISFGEEKPACTAHAESCWSENRRADLVRRSK